MAAPQTTQSWTVEGQTGFDSLKFNESKAVPAVGDSECLVKIQGASLNYRDLIIPMGKYPFGFTPSVIPGSDGAGTIVTTGKNVTRFKKGDKVLTLFNQGHLGGELTKLTSATGLGGTINGTLRQYGAFDENGLVAMPENLNFLEASTLCCAGLTAWNALYGLKDKQLKAGDWVLTQGTGGVSIFGVQFAKAAGAKVIATTSSDEKAKLLKKLGADHIINYKTTPKWGEAARALTPGGRGMDHIIEVAGPASMRESLACITLAGVITIIGFVGGAAKKDEGEPGFLEALTNQCTIRGILVGSRTMLEDMCRAIEANDFLKPIVDDKVFGLPQLRDAYEHMWSQKHQGKVCIKIDS